MKQPISQFSPSPSNNSPLIPIVISILVTAIVVGGGIFGWMNQKQQAMKGEIVSLHNQLDQIKQVSPTPPTNANGQKPTTTPQSNFEAYQARQAKIAELKANPQLTVDDIYDLQQIISFSEWKDLFDAARKAVVKGSIGGIQFDLVFNWKKGNWVHFNVIPESVETDIAQLYLEKVGGSWKTYGPGTAFPDLYDQHPELFK